MQRSKEWTQDDSDSFLAKIPLRRRDSNPRPSNFPHLVPAVSPFGASIQPMRVHDEVIMLFRI